MRFNQRTQGFALWVNKQHWTVEGETWENHLDLQNYPVVLGDQKANQAGRYQSLEQPVVQSRRVTENGGLVGLQMEMLTMTNHQLTDKKQKELSKGGQCLHKLWSSCSPTSYKNSNWGRGWVYPTQVFPTFGAFRSHRGTPSHHPF